MPTAPPDHVWEIWRSKARSSSHREHEHEHEREHEREREHARSQAADRGALESLAARLAAVRDIRQLRALRDHSWQLRLARPDIAFYSTQLRHLISNLPPLPAPTLAPPPGWPRDPGAAWGMRDDVPNARVGVSQSPAAGGVSWGVAARCLPYGAALLALLALVVKLVRVAQRCRSNGSGKFHTRRQEDPEWHTPDILALHQQYRENNEEAHPLPDVNQCSAANNTLTSITVELPPPYSECGHNKPTSEEPPPPYSACYVAYAKDRIPKVHFYRHELTSQNTGSHQFGHDGGVQRDGIGDQRGVMSGVLNAVQLDTESTDRVRLV